MRIIAVCSSKGGTGKTTLSSILAVKAAQAGGKVALFDTDPQSSLGRWWQLRGEPDNPCFVETTASIEAIELMIAEGWSTVIIDTPPSNMELIQHAIYSAQFVLIPSQASPVDVEAFDAVVDLCVDRESGELLKPFAFVLNAVPNGWGALADSSEKCLADIGPVLKTRLALRKPYRSAMALGKSGAETDRSGAARQEVDALWAEIGRVMRKAAKVA